MSDHEGIDWEALAKAAYAARIPFLQAYNTKAATLSSRGMTDEEWLARYEAIMTEGLVPIARAVVAAYQEQRAAQGYVEVPDLWLVETLGFLSGYSQCKYEAGQPYALLEDLVGRLHALRPSPFAEDTLGANAG